MNSLELRSRIRSNPIVKKAKLTFDRANKIQIDQLEAELEQMQKIRVAQRLDVNEGLIDQLIHSLARDAAYRSRITEINLTAVKVRHLYEKRVELLKNEINSNFSEELREVCRTINERSAYIDAVLSPFIDYIRNISRLMDQCALIVIDIDKVYWHHKTILDGINSHAKKELYV
jgi:hypothetical protein